KGRSTSAIYTLSLHDALPILTIKDAAAYGLILTQGHGTFAGLQVSTPAMIRFGEMTEDELFVSADAASAGVAVTNRSESDPLVIDRKSTRLNSSHSQISYAVF